MSSFMDLQGNVLNLDQELSYVASMECPFVDFNFQETFLSKVKFLLTGKRNMFKSGYVLVHRSEDVGNKDPLSIYYLIFKETNP